MQNIRGVPSGQNNLTKEDRILKQVREHKVDLYAVMESGIYNEKKPPILIPFNKNLHNNIQEPNPFKHKTPLGAGMLLWANNRITL